MAKSKGSKRGRKKKRVAAHIKEAAGKRAAAANSGGGEGDVSAPLLAAPLGVGRPKRPRDEAVPKVEDPTRKDRERTEATNYLAAWIAVREVKREAEAAGVDGSAAGQGLWKFNKNRQAWLLRHIFSEQEIDGGVFGKLCLYVEGLKGAGRERVLAEAQEIISKHGPDEEEEETAASREASTPAIVEPAHETVEEQSVTVPSGYNSDSTEDGEGSDDDHSSNGDGQGVVGDKKAVALPGAGASNPPSASAAGGFSFSFSDANSAEVSNATSADATVVRHADDGSSSSSDDDGSGDDGDQGVKANAPVEGGQPGAVNKRPRKVRAALTGQAKAAAKTRAGAVAYERALQVAEMLS